MNSVKYVCNKSVALSGKSTSRDADYGFVYLVSLPTKLAFSCKIQVLQKEALDLNCLPIVLTVEEVSILLRVNRNTIYELFQRGQLPGGRKVGRSIRFSREAVIQWLRGNVLISKD